MKSIAASVVFAFAVTLPSAHQQSSACALLTSAEITAATGAKADDPVGGDQIVKSSPDTHMCMWRVTTQQGQLSLGTGPLPAGMKAETIAKNNPGMDALRKAKYTMVEKEYGDTWCSVLSPPSTKGMFLTSCAGPVKGKVVSLTYMSPTSKLDLDKAKGLLDKALGRQR